MKPPTSYHLWWWKNRMLNLSFWNFPSRTWQWVVRLCEYPRMRAMIDEATETFGDQKLINHGWCLGTHPIMVRVPALIQVVQIHGVHSIFKFMLEDLRFWELVAGCVLRIEYRVSARAIGPAQPLSWFVWNLHGIRSSYAISRQS